MVVDWKNTSLDGQVEADQIRAANGVNPECWEALDHLCITIPEFVALNITCPVRRLDLAKHRADLSADDYQHFLGTSFQDVRPIVLHVRFKPNDDSLHLPGVWQPVTKRVKCLELTIVLSSLQEMPSVVDIVRALSSPTITHVRILFEVDYVYCKDIEPGSILLARDILIEPIPSVVYAQICEKPKGLSSTLKLRSVYWYQGQSSAGDMVEGRELSMEVGNRMWEDALELQ